MDIRRCDKWGIAIYPIAICIFVVLSCTENLYLTEYSNEPMLFEVEIQNNWKSLSGIQDKVADDNAPYLLGADTECPVSVSTSIGFYEPAEASRVTTRSKPFTSTTNPFGSNDYYGVVAYVYDSTWDNFQTCLASNMKVDKDGNTTGKFYWPESGKIRFYSYYPYKADAVTASKGTAPTITYTVPEKVGDQADVLVTSQATDVATKSGTVPIKFKHTMTAIRFATGNLIGCTIKRIGLKGVSGKGTYNLATGTNWEVSTLAAERRDFYIYPNYVTVGPTATEQANQIDTSVSSEQMNIIMHPDDSTMIMLPQTLPTGATLIVELEKKEVTGYDDGKLTLSYDLGGNTWSPNTTVTYTINSTSINYSFSATQPGTFTHKAGSTTMTITSHQWFKSGHKKACGWSAEYYDSDGNKLSQRPSWLHMPDNGNGSLTGETITISVDDNTSSYETIQHNAVLAKEANVRGTESDPFDLSMYYWSGSDYKAWSKGQNTANCYPVHGAGTYMIPLVYGNAIKYGNDNKDAYHTDNTAETGSVVLNDFIDARGEKITQPYIYANNSSYYPKGACLMWQDVDGMITPTSVKLCKPVNGKNTYVQFSIDRSKIQQGNAVIAVLDKEWNGKTGADTNVNQTYEWSDTKANVMWSWHIWVTNVDVEQGVVVTNYQGRQNTFMTVNLGWIYGNEEAIHYFGRSTRVVITQKDDNGNPVQGTNADGTKYNITTSFTVSQGDQYLSEESLTGICPHYSWGRKDPFPGINCGTGAVVPIYNQMFTNATANTFTDKGGTTRTFTKGTPEGIFYSTNSFNIDGNILTPMLYTNNNNMMPYTCVADNLWDMSNKSRAFQSKAVVKTIYDPCPVGFTVPSMDCFTGFTTDGENHSGLANKSYFNVDWGDDNDEDRKVSKRGWQTGWYFFIDVIKDGTRENFNTVFIPAASYRDNANPATTTNPSNLNGRYWTSGSTADNTAMMMQFNSTEIRPVQAEVGAYPKRTARPTRPIKDIYFNEYQ